MKTFYKRIWAFLAIAGLFSAMAAISSCSKDNDGSDPYVCAACGTTPDALAVNDANVKGIYKGIMAGSTGTISIDIQNGSNTITATLVIDGTAVSLVSNVSVVDGQPYVAPFTGTYNGNPITLHFSVGLGGMNPTIVTSDIPGHPNADFEIFKETSTSMIEAFEGTYTSGSETGVFNIVLSRSLAKWGGVAKENGSGEVSHGSGIINANDQFIDEDGTDIGQIDGDEFNGSFTGGDGAAVVLSGQRTL